MRSEAPLTELVRRHRDLDRLLVDSRTGFVSDWEGSHPYVKSFLGHLSSQVTPEEGRYVFFDEHESVLDAIAAFHRNLENLTIDRSNVVAGPGSSSFLTALSLWLLHKGYDELYYVPPIYYTFHFFLRLLGIRVRPVSGRQPFERGFRMNLPNRRSALLMSDPIWYAGKRLSCATVEAIKDWQLRTDSIVIVDGSFQYMQWDGRRQERTSQLELNQTIRLICPTKALAIPFFRFAYALHPARYHDDFLFIYESIVGGASASDLAFAARSMEVLSGEDGNKLLTNHLREVYEELIADRLIETCVTPECGYFAFAIPQSRLPVTTAMDESYFELKRYPGYFRINLMKASAALSRDTRSEIMQAR